MDDRTERQFFQLLRAGLWGVRDDVSAESFDGADWGRICQVAKDQAVAGIIGDGVAAYKTTGAIGDLSSEIRNKFIRGSYSIEKNNENLNVLLSNKASALEEQGIRAVLMKGQGIAYRYPAPNHRTSGDIDFLLTPEDYSRAVDFLKPQADSLETEYSEIKHYGMHFGKFEIELHGTLSCGFGKKFDSVLDQMQSEMFSSDKFILKEFNGVPVRLPSEDFDAVYIFAHFIKHFYQEGLGLRQVCDWTMLLHSCVQQIDTELLEGRIKAIGMMKEWKSFGCLAVQWLGLPAEEMPFYDPSFSKFVPGIWKLMLLSGNFGHKRTAFKGIAKSKGIAKKWKKFSARFSWTIRHYTFSPYNTIRSIGGRLRESFINIKKGQL